MIIKSAKDFGGRLHPDVLGYKCFRCDLALRRYPVVEWQGAVEGKEFGAIFLHRRCARRLGKELLAETKSEESPRRSTTDD